MGSVDTFKKNIMKITIALICLIPIVMCAPQRKFIETLGLGGTSLFDLDTLKCDIQLMLDVLGTDPTEQACEAECHKLLQQGHILNYGCPLVCHGFQNLVHVWHVTPDTTDPTNSKCSNPGAALG